MEEESDVDISTLPIEEDNMDLDCESLIQALNFYNKIVELSEPKELRKRSRKLLHINALAIVKIVASQNTYIAQLEGRMQEMEKTLATKISSDQNLISEAVASEMAKHLPIAPTHAQIPSYAAMTAHKEKETASKAHDKRERSKNRLKPDKKFLTAIKPLDTTTSSNSTKVAVQSKIDIKKAKIGIKNVKFIKNGGLLVETESEEDLDKLIEEFKQIDELSNKYTINKPIDRKPQIICFDVSKDLEEKQLLEYMEMQFAEEGARDEKNFSIKHHFPSKKGINWIVEEFISKTIEKYTFNTTDNIEAQIKHIQDDIKQACSNTNLKHSRYHQPKNAVWWTKELKIKRSKTRALRRLCQKEKNDNIRLIKLKAYKKSQAEYKKLILNTKATKFKLFISNITTSNIFGKNFKTLTDKKKRATSLSHIQKEDGSFTASIHETHLEILKFHFPCILTDNFTLSPFENNDTFIPITTTEIETVLDRIKPRKAAGIDGIPGEIVKELYYAKPSWFTNLFNILLMTGYFPNLWKQARIVLIPKTNRDYTRPPICILPCWGKVFDKIIAERLTYYLEDQHLLSNKQFGFRKQKSTIDALQCIKDFISNAQTSNHLTCIISLDIANAFNSTTCTLLKHLLSSLDIPNYLKNILFSFLEDRHVILGDINHKYNIGIPQGSCLGPILWNIFINDLLGIDLGPSSHIQAFADDVHENSLYSIYTDGSRMDNHTGSAFVVFRDGVEIHHDTSRLNNEATVFQAELHAIEIAIHYIVKNNINNAAIITDSRSTLMALANPRNYDPNILRIKNTIKNFKHIISFHWIKAHIGIQSGPMVGHCAACPWRAQVHGVWAGVFAVRGWGCFRDTDHLSRVPSGWAYLQFSALPYWGGAEPDNYIRVL
ncbi:uncharacterized protein CDAR_187221 [Caerostris darwini]|uniref:Reverse transcriptase domain-containing protein n=2 Tax=Caerostris darwini TaxID=1538125 RepID=A0AAV4V5U4_9ARAC|nr:uncharacterized protein CDAR_187221 [Caerostris darwini]